MSTRTKKKPHRGGTVSPADRARRRERADLIKAVRHQTIMRLLAAKLMRSITAADRELRVLADFIREREGEEAGPALRRKAVGG